MKIFFSVNISASINWRHQQNWYRFLFVNSFISHRLFNIWGCFTTHIQKQTKQNKTNKQSKQNKIYKSAHQASKELNIYPSSIMKVCRGEFSQTKGRWISGIAISFDLTQVKIVSIGWGVTLYNWPLISPSMRFLFRERFPKERL